MIQFKENARTDRRKDGKTGGRKDRPYFIGPFQLPPGFQKSTPNYNFDSKTQIRTNKFNFKNNAYYIISSSKKQIKTIAGLYFKLC